MHWTLVKHSNATAKPTVDVLENASASPSKGGLCCYQECQGFTQNLDQFVHFFRLGEELRPAEFRRDN